MDIERHTHSREISGKKMGWEHRGGHEIMDRREYARLRVNCTLCFSIKRSFREQCIKFVVVSANELRD